jgi:adenosyl cobinamide kinase/adenosyl cobinamide phosphate guanylyltransferase
MLYTIKPDNNVMDKVRHHLTMLHPDKSWDVTIKPHKKNRTAQQNNYMHKLCRILSDYTGYGVEEVKHCVVDSLGLWVEFSTKHGEVKRTLKSTSSMNTVELNTVIERLQQTCLKLDLQIPMPKDYGYE